MSEMIERVARAILRESHSEADGDYIKSIPDHPLWRAVTNEARAAIAAMREPTEAMREAADTYDFSSGVRGSYTLSLHHWRAMIDEALK